MNDLSDTWSPGIEYILEEIRLNSITISEQHKEKYYSSKGYLKYFRIPTILFSAMNSVFSVGLQPYCPQPIISLICCIISLVCGVISSVELFLSIQSTMENELIASKDFYLLSVDIFKILSLERGTRMINGKTYLDETYQTYCKLIENSNIVNAEMKNMITPSGHLSLSPKLLSTTKEDVSVELTSLKNKPILLINEKVFDTEEKVEKVEKVKEEERNQALFPREERNTQINTNTIIQKENILIQELEENNKPIIELEQEEQEEEEKEKEKENDTSMAMEEKDATLSEEEEHLNEIIPKTKRKYTKKTKMN